jgi:hypothetical protein
VAEADLPLDQVVGKAMRNTYNITLLRKRIVDALPRALSPAGESALEGFLALPGASAWRPDRMGLRELSFVFDVGLPFSFVRENPSARGIALRIGDAVRDGRPPDASIARIAHAAALLTQWGSVVEFAADPAQPSFVVHATRGATFAVVVAAPGADPAAAASEGDGRGSIVAAHVDGGHERVATALDAAWAQSATLAGYFTFEPRFWIGIEQKEWLYLSRARPGVADVPDLGDATGVRHAVRIPLLI